ncbi:hypothetical protein [Sorangium sp. So ce131]|uniref:hypothetical protein n=1 Tax=Sorangium sp. So ce131 TaxID=3133282 RepID=UPI003F5ED1C0
MSLAERVARAVDAAPVVDLHTHLFAPQFGALNLWGVDELLTYHYLVAEVLRAEPKVSPEAFFARDKAAQADLVWDALFVRRSPLSEATSGVATVLHAFGLDPAAKDLREARAFFAARRVEQHVEDVLRLAGVTALAMTNDPTDPAERAIWEAGVAPDPRFHAALRIDRLVSSQDLARELDRWIARMRPRYLAISVEEVAAPPRAVLDACRAHDLPFAMMIGVRRAVNPRLGVAGDGMRAVSLAPLESLAAENPDVRFLVTTLARENTHGLCVVARKFANVLPFGCWWFMNNPSLIEETTSMRLEMLGPTFVPQHSDARVLDQLIYKWRHARRAIASALTRRYAAMSVPPTDAQIERDARALLGGIAGEWLGA